MAAVASMMMKAPTALNCGAVQRNSVYNISRLPHSGLKVKCMAKDPQETSPTEGVSSSSSTKMSTRFGDLFAFSGPAPEIINGRAAMLGFVSAIAVEVASGRDLLSQVNSGGLSWFVLTAGLMTVGTLVPLFNGISRESKSQQIFSSTAEMWNGRFAMLGLLALAFTEYVKGGPLV
ncbi:early light-induced protein 2, chloroplastic-like [Cryptomeria japonica]|uniref:early light-induced protein 2, chloroplastic-like n=1 Tax=Cryptomeria japonica TaxID=3369 RepID=UPI0027DA8D24|nr:early light-induced protein 2, chloroplastic-like [Cryptomeria japonica]